jgi:hypothetical protein
MPFLFDTMTDTYLGYAAIFACIGFGFVCLINPSKKESGIVLWSLSFFANCIGFVFWAGTLRLNKIEYLFGEVFHIAGFFLLLAGACIVAKYEVKTWLKIAIFIWFLAWGIAIITFTRQSSINLAVLKFLRSLIVAFAGFVLLNEKKDKRSIGTVVAGTSLMVWGLYISVFIFFKISTYLYYGFLVGFHILAALGMVAFIVEKMRLRAEKSEKIISKLEGILPICAYCKKIRDSKNVWHTLEEYIEDRSEAEFSHGICPECFQKHKPDR